MDEVSDVEAQMNLPALLDRIERGGELVITRDGKPVPRLVGSLAKTRGEQAVENLQALRRELAAEGRLLSLDELLAYRDEGRR